ncbi:MAG: hypothetical protein EXR69_02400 [Myxococcales bacterium]|nr:hypothetical protein [Myxococcales bacterium]
MLLLLGCTHLAMVDGAVPVDPGYNEFSADLQGSRDPNVLQTPLAIPLPSFAFHFRRGIGENIDFGAHIYPLGLGVDLRYRFLESNGWSLATQPGVSGIIMPIPTLQYGQIDLSLPVKVEHALGERWGYAFGPGVIFRQTFYAAQAEEFSSSTATFELYGGGGARVFHDWPKLRFGISGDLYVDTLRATGLYGGIGVDLAFTHRGGPRSYKPPRPENG